MALFAPATLSLIACGSQAPTQADDSPSQANTKPAAERTAISASYLSGAWCFRRSEAGDHVEDVGLTYIFSQDGSLLYQNNPQTSVDRPGGWEFADGVLKIKPTLTFFDFKPVEVTQDQMVLEAHGGRHIWTRGACA